MRRVFCERAFILRIEGGKTTCDVLHHLRGAGRVEPDVRVFLAVLVCMRAVLVRLMLAAFERFDPGGGVDAAALGQNVQKEGLQPETGDHHSAAAAENLHLIDAQ